MKQLDEKDKKIFLSLLKAIHSDIKEEPTIDKKISFETLSPRIVFQDEGWSNDLMGPSLEMDKDFERMNEDDMFCFDFVSPWDGFGFLHLNGEDDFRQNVELDWEIVDKKDVFDFDFGEEKDPFVLEDNL